MSMVFLFATDAFVIFIVSAESLGENMMKATVPSDRSAVRRIPDAHGWLRLISRIRSCSATRGRGDRAA